MRKFETIKKYEGKIELPKRQTKGSAGYDLAIIKDYKIKPGEIVLVETGLKVSMAEYEVLLVFPRSSLGIKKGLTMSNNVGVIDSDYYNNKDNEGHIMIPLLNFSKEIVHLTKGERVAQGIFIKYLKTSEEDDSHIQRLGGFGSTI